MEQSTPITADMLQHSMSEAVHALIVAPFVGLLIVLIGSMILAAAWKENKR